MQINIDKLKIKKHHLCIISIILFSTTNIFASDNHRQNFRASLRAIEAAGMTGQEDERAEDLESDVNQLAATGGSAGGAVVAEASPEALSPVASPEATGINQGGGSNNKNRGGGGRNRHRGGRGKRNGGAAGGAVVDSSEVASASPMVEDTNQGSAVGGGVADSSEFASASPMVEDTNQGALILHPTANAEREAQEERVRTYVEEGRKSRYFDGAADAAGGGAPVIVDANQGALTVNPDSKALNEAKQRYEAGVRSALVGGGFKLKSSNNSKAAAGGGGGGGGMQNTPPSLLGDGGLVSATQGKKDNLHKAHGKHHHAKKYQDIKQQNNYQSAAKKAKSKNSIWTDVFFGSMEGRPNSGIDKATGNYGYYSLGFNHKLNDKNNIGLIYSYSSDSMNMNNDVKSQEASQGSKVTLHLNHKLTKDIFSDILVGYGVYNQQNTNIKKVANNDKIQFNAFDTLIRLGQDMTTKFGIIITPTVGMHYVNKVQSGPSDLGFSNLGYYSVSALLGTKITTNIKLNKYKLQPSVHLNLLQGIKDNYQNNGVLESQKIYSTYNLGLGMQLINSNIFSVDLGYDFFINKQTYNHSGALTLKLAL